MTRVRWIPERRNAQGIGEPQLGCTGLDQIEQFARVLGGSEVDTNARILTGNRPMRVAVGSAARVGRHAKDRTPDSSPETAITAARPIARSRSTCRAGPRSAVPAG